MYPEINLKRCAAFWVSLALWSFLCVILLPESVLAQQGIKWGRVEIHPGLAFETKYNDNVFLEADKTFASGGHETAHEDFIFTTSPSLLIEQKKQKGDHFGFLLKYLGQDEKYIDLKEQDFFKQDILGHIEVGSTGGDVVWTLGGQFVDTRDPISVEFAANFVPRQDRTTYEVETSLLSLFTPDFQGKIEGSFKRILFGQEQLSIQESDTYDAKGTILWKTTSLSEIGFNYSFRFIDYLEASTINFDSAMQSASLIWKWAPLSVFSSEFWVGFNHLAFEGLEGQDRDDLIYKVGLNYKPKSTRQWSVIGSREIPNSYFEDIQAFEKTVGQLNFNQKIGVKWMVDGQASIQVNKYNIAAIDVAGGGSSMFRKDERLSGMLSLTYAVQEWLDVKMEYTYAINDSNFDNFDYSNNIVFLRFSIDL